jgi:hypothetical protein
VSEILDLTPNWCCWLLEVALLYCACTERSKILWNTKCSYFYPVIISAHLGSHLRVSIPIFIQQDATLHYLYLETALHVSDGTTTHHQERIQLCLQHLVFVTPLLLSAAIVEELELVAADSSNGVTNIRCCRHSFMRSCWWVDLWPKTCRTVSKYNEMCNVISSWIYIGIWVYPCYY